MGRKRTAKFPAFTETSAAQQPAVVAPIAPERFAEPTKQRCRYLVTLAAQTPLRHVSLEVEADNATEAKAKFNTANGISGSVHPYTVTEL